MGKQTLYLTLVGCIAGLYLLGLNLAQSLIGSSADISPAQHLINNQNQCYAARQKKQKTPAKSSINTQILGVTAPASLDLSLMDTGYEPRVEIPGMTAPASLDLSLMDTGYDPKLSSKKIKNFPEFTKFSLCSNFINNPKTEHDDFKDDDDTTLLARMIFGEQRGSSCQSQVAVGFTALNRLNVSGKNKEKGSGRFYGSTLREIILAKDQYKCFKEGNLDVMKDPFSHEPRRVWRECYEIARELVTGRIGEDPSGGATHVLSVKRMDGKIVQTTGAELPYWADMPDRMPKTAEIQFAEDGWNWFYKEK